MCASQEASRIASIKPAAHTIFTCAYPGWPEGSLILLRTHQLSS